MPVKLLQLVFILRKIIVAVTELLNMNQLIEVGHIANYIFKCIISMKILRIWFKLHWIIYKKSEIV